MFTGIIRAIGTVTDVTTDPMGGRKITIQPDQPSDDAIISRTLDNLTMGSSVACSGVCLTVTNLGKNSFCADLGDVTCTRTTAGRWQVGTRLNLERALRAGDELGGHFVAGHVDVMATLVGKNQNDGAWRLTFAVPAEIRPFLAARGSVAVDGVSLTIVCVNDASQQAPTFEVMVVPHTWNVTTLGSRDVGDLVNVEVDLLARYVLGLNR